MSDNLNVARSGSRVVSKIMTNLGKSSIGSNSGISNIKRNCWWAEGAPSVDANSHGTYPVELGDFAYDITNDSSYVCTVAPAASTAATFTQIA